MPYIRRDIESIVLTAAQSYAALIVTGPRQVGKSTTLRHLADPRRTLVTLDDLESRQLAQSDPELFLSLHKPPVLIDEVQYAPQLFERIKIVIDNDVVPGSFWMTGSQPFRLMDLAQESLAGRAAILQMPTLSQHEIYGGTNNEPFSLDFDVLARRAEGRRPIKALEQFERIWRGSMPGHVSGGFPARDLFYSSYLQTYIGRDIRDMFSGVDSLGFVDFIRAAACRISQVLNVHDLARDVGVSDETAKRWLGLLEKSGVVFYLRPYSNNLLKRTIKSPKLYFFDTGLVAYLTKYTSPEVLMNGALNGAILENYVVAELYKSYSNRGLEAVCHYYRDKDGKEIDLVMQRDGELLPIEIKKTASPSPGLTGVFKLLDKSSMPRGTGAVVCLKEELSAIDRSTMIVPVWML
ncbi:MAG: ATP-binding protein [Coriobacteriales bacterium]|jgi:predicted AAA+ superfamily ATPase|nr:ATP-binding protein [Coriobacteriales bacterium]